MTVVAHAASYSSKLADRTCTQTPRGAAAGRQTCVVLGWIVLWERTIVSLARARSFDRPPSLFISSHSCHVRIMKRKPNSNGKCETRAPACHFRLRSIFYLRKMQTSSTIQAAFPAKREEGNRRDCRIDKLLSVGKNNNRKDLTAFVWRTAALVLEMHLYAYLSRHTGNNSRRERRTRCGNEHEREIAIFRKIASLKEINEMKKKTTLHERAGERW